MKGYGRNTLIKTLRELGVSDSERREMRELARELQNENFYKNVEQINREVLGDSITRTQLNYENMLRNMSYSGKSFKEVLEDYREEQRNVEQGTTSSVESYFQAVSSDLHRLFFPQATPNILKSIYNSGAWQGFMKYVELLLKYENIEVRKGSKLEYDIQQARLIIEGYLEAYSE